MKKDKRIGKWVDEMNLINTKEKVLKKEESFDWWYPTILVFFFFFLGICFYSFFADGLGIKEISGFLSAVAAIFAGSIAYIGTKKIHRKQ